jgi:hypothetical protein
VQAGELVMIPENLLDQINAKDVAHVDEFAMANKNPTDQFHRELIVACQNRSVGGENAHLADQFNILPLCTGAAIFAHLLFKKIQCQESGVPFVHVKASEMLKSNRAQHLDPAYAKNDFLAEAVVLIATV